MIGTIDRSLLSRCRFDRIFIWPFFALHRVFFSSALGLSSAPAMSAKKRFQFFMLIHFAIFSWMLENNCAKAICFLYDFHYSQLHFSVRSFSTYFSFLLICEKRVSVKRRWKARVKRTHKIHNLLFIVKMCLLRARRLRKTPLNRNRSHFDCVDLLPRIDGAIIVMLNEKIPQWKWKWMRDFMVLIFLVAQK